MAVIIKAVVSFLADTMPVGGLRLILVLVLCYTWMAIRLRRATTYRTSLGKYICRS